jgi:ferredoxin-NADP reductase
VPWLGWTCGTCAFCTSGQENLCDAAGLNELNALAPADRALTLVGIRADGLPDSDALFGRVDGLANRVVQFSGPVPLTDAARNALEHHGVPAASIHFERFDFR